MSVSITVRDAHKNFDGHAALRGVTVGAKKGELVALLGPSGSGKTTLLRAIAGLEQLDGGSVHFDALDVSRLPLRERGIGFVFQSYALFRHMSVFENIAFGMRARPRRQRPTESDIARRVAELLDLVQLPELGKRFPSQLSGGQRQRVALARALAIEPRVLLLDEPFGALDAKVRRDLRAWLRALHERIGLTTIFVTHDQEEALELADRVAILNDGRIEQIDTPDGIYDNPATEFVCRFLGDASRIPVRVVHGEARIGNVPVLTTLRSGSSLYVRPPDVRIAENATPLQGIVAGARRVGGLRRLDITLPGADGAHIEIDHAGEPPMIGERVGLRVERGWVF